MDLPRLKIGVDIGSGAAVYIIDRYTHVLLMGKSGTGKSTSIANWWQQDDFHGNAKVLVDPSGFLSRDCFSISKGRALYCSLQTPISINPMMSAYDENQVSDIVAEAINQVIAITTGNQVLTAKMRDILDQSVKWNLRNNRKSLIHVLDHIKNLPGNSETRDGIIARLSYLLNNEKMVKILCGNNSIEWGELIAKKQTLILSCAGMSTDKMVFAGSLVTHGINSYFRFASPKKYLPLSVYLDECHNFVSPSLATCLKEARKYNLSFCLSTQDFAVIEGSMARVMLNVGNIVSYRLGYREASYVSKELDMTPQELQFLEKYHVAFLTSKGTGIAKAPRPPFFIPREPPKVVAPQPKSSKPRWFTRTSYQRPDPK